MLCLLYVFLLQFVSRHDKLHSLEILHLSLSGGRVKDAFMDTFWILLVSWMLKTSAETSAGARLVSLLCKSSCGKCSGTSSFAVGSRMGLEHTVQEQCLFVQLYLGCYEDAVSALCVTLD